MYPQTDITKTDSQIGATDQGPTFHAVFTKNLNRRYQSALRTGELNVGGAIKPLATLSTLKASLPDSMSIKPVSNSMMNTFTNWYRKKRLKALNEQSLKRFLQYKRILDLHHRLSKSSDWDLISDLAALLFLWFVGSVCLLTFVIIVCLASGVELR